MPGSAPLPLYTVLPFVAMLLAIALFPLWLPHWLESNRNKLVVSAVLAAPILLLYLVRQPAALSHTAADYVSFIVLLAGLYVIAGGILLRGDLEATPLVNTAFLALGSLLASFVGTTGASMLLIRPLLQTNRERARVTHTVVFFIFLVSNIGACSPRWGIHRSSSATCRAYRSPGPSGCGPVAAMTVALLRCITSGTCAITRTRRGRPPARSRPDRAAPDHGRAQRGLARRRGGGGGLPARAGARARHPGPGRRSLWRTPRAIRRANQFTADPMVEVAVLFLGIFLTMIPTLEMLHVRGGELGVREPWQFFSATGLLSSFLDNALDYLTFLALAQA